jgi:hypothetical protein
MAILASNLTATQLQELVLNNLGYEFEEDGANALAMAKRVAVGCQRLLILRPIEIQQGGVGRGSGFSIAWDVASLKEQLERVRQFVAQRSTNVADFFGTFAADPRELQAPFEEC